MSKRTHSFIWGGLGGAVFIALGLFSSLSDGDFSLFGGYCALGVMAFTLISCLILGNNFIGDMIAEIFSWGFVTMPGLIFTLDLDGIIWLLTVKLLFWILGFILAALCGILAIVLGLVVSVFVYPFALYKNIKHGETDNI